MRQRARWAAAGAVLGILGLFAINYGAFHVHRIMVLDASLYNQFADLRTHQHVQHLASVIANLCDPFPYVYLCAIPVAIALYRRRAGLALMILTILMGANFTTELLKPRLHEFRDTRLVHHNIPASGSWPSGHATASMALALCLVLAVSPRFRPWAAAIGALFTLAVSYSFLTLGWHYPTDAAGGMLMATTWTFAAVAVRSAVQRRGAAWPQRARARAGSEVLFDLAPLVGAALAAVALVVAIVVAKPESIVPFAAGHQRLVAAVAAFATLAFAVSGGLLLVLRRAPRTEL